MNLGIDFQPRSESAQIYFFSVIVITKSMESIFIEILYLVVSRMIRVFPNVLAGHNSMS